MTEKTAATTTTAQADQPWLRTKELTRKISENGRPEGISVEEYQINLLAEWVDSLEQNNALGGGRLQLDRLVRDWADVEDVFLYGKEYVEGGETLHGFEGEIILKEKEGERVQRKIPVRRGDFMGPTAAQEAKVFFEGRGLYTWKFAVRDDYEPNRLEALAFSN